MPRSLQARVLCALVAFVVGFGTVRQSREPVTGGSSPPEAPESAAAAPREAPRPAHRPDPSPPRLSEADGNEAEGARCDPERQALLEYGVRAARAELLTRYGRPPATSLPAPSDDEIDAVFPDALASLVSCTPPPCRLSVATWTRIDDFKGLPAQWGYPHGEVRAGTGRNGVYVYEFAFMADELSAQEWKFVRNAWSVDRVHLDEMLPPLGEVDQ